MRDFVKKFRNRTGKNFLIVSLLNLAVGLILVLVPTRMHEAIYVIGGLLLSVGIFMLLMGLTEDKRADYWPFGAVFAAFAVWMLVCYKYVLAHVYLFFGLTVLVSGIADLCYFLKIRYTYGESEIPAILVSAVSAVLGIVILFHPIESEEGMLIFAGAVFLGRGILSFIYYRRLQEQN